MSENAFGRAAHRAYWMTLLRGDEPTDSYDDEEAEYRASWDASAQAVLDQAFPGLRRQLNEARKALRQITGYAVGKGLEAGALAGIRDIAGKALAAADGASAGPQPAPGLAAAMAERDDLREQLAAADRATAEFRRQCSELAGELGAARAVVREMDAHIASGDDYAAPAKRAEWRQRAGIGDGQ